MVERFGNLSWRRVALLGALLFAFGAAAGYAAQTANADAGSVNLTCGTNDGSGNSDARPVSGLTHSKTPTNVSVWNTHVQWKCPQGSTWMIELQQSTDNGAHWTDLSTTWDFGVTGYHHIFNTPVGGCSLGCSVEITLAGPACWNSGRWYRTHVWNHANRDYVSAYVTDGQC